MKEQSRRDFLKDSTSALGGSWVSLNLPLILAAAQSACSHQASGKPWANLTEQEAVTLAAVTDQIIPPDESPGASEAGVVYFIDVALGSFFAANAGKLRDGFRDLDKRAGSTGFAGLTLDEQTALLKTIESSFFFRAMLDLTRWGMFALPEYGGNRDHAGWKLIGFEHRHVWQAPFGYYDEQAARAEVENAAT